MASMMVSSNSVASWTISPTPGPPPHGTHIDGVSRPLRSAAANPGQAVHAIGPLRSLQYGSPMTSDHGSRTRPGVALWGSAILLAAVAVAGCGPSEQPDPASLFANNCAVCHGPAGAGVEDQGPPLLKDAYLVDALSDKAIATAVRHGVASSEERWAPMPSFPRFDDDELDAVVGYVRELQRRAALTDG